MLIFKRSRVVFSLSGDFLILGSRLFKINIEVIFDNQGKAFESLDSLFKSSHLYDLVVTFDEQDFFDQGGVTFP